MSAWRKDTTANEEEQEQEQEQERGRSTQRPREGENCICAEGKKGPLYTIPLLHPKQWAWSPTARSGTCRRSEESEMIDLVAKDTL